MTKRKSPAAKPYTSLKSPSAGADGRGPKVAKVEPPVPALRRHVPSQAAIRETIESVAIAFVLAFLFRTFEAEAFVIPTGSMAPTLMGRHKDLVCPKCGFEYQVGASELTQEGSSKGADPKIESGTCPMCRYTMNWAPPEHYRSFNGDRILVSKVAYQFNAPERWDVAVFKYPGDANINYIKRLVGLPHERIRIRRGDIYVKRARQADDPREPDFEIARKPPRKLLAMLQPVFDNDLTPAICKYGWPLRWSLEHFPGGAATGAWQPLDGGQAFQTDGSAAEETWIRYQHRVPSFRQWERMEREGRLPPKEQVLPQLISDFAPYNTGRNEGAILHNPAPDPQSLGLDWVGDLALRCTLEVQSDNGQVVFELIKGGRTFQCRIELSSGAAALAVSGPDMEDFRPTAATAVSGPGRHEIAFSNCDEQLLLWVDGREVPFDRETTYPPLGNTRPQEIDLAPIGIGSAGAALRVSHLKIFRDIYYIADRYSRDRDRVGLPHDFSEEVLIETILSPPFLSDPKMWDAFDHMKVIKPFVLGKDQFLMLGDNSTMSKDSRLWEQGPDVKRELLIGKALFIYWPHSWDAPVPFFPNFARMGFVR
jgi:signal peptidase I